MVEKNDGEQLDADRAPFLRGVRVLEVADELGEYCGKLLAGLGADVIKVEPPEGEVTRHYGPFYHDDHDINRSLYFWHYNFGKRGIVVNFDDPDDVERFGRLAATADVLLDTRSDGFMASRGLGFAHQKEMNPGLVYARISPFGDEGPWSKYLASDLVHLALGGVMMNCGYDPEPSGRYDSAPIAPQMWQSYHVAGEMAVMGIVSALIYRLQSGIGQRVSTSVHQAVSLTSEIDLPNWVFLRQEHYRLTCRHSQPAIDRNDPLSIAMTKDGRWLLPSSTHAPLSDADFEKTLRLLKQWDMQADLEDEQYRDLEYRSSMAGRAHINDVVHILVGKLNYDRELWRAAQEEGLAWAPIVRPEENRDNPHWRKRGTFVDVAHPELDETFGYVGAKWYCPDTAWGSDRRAPLLGEHTDEVFAELGQGTRGSVDGRSSADRADPVHLSAGKPWALQGTRVLDLTWMLATAGAGRYLAALGAEVIRVEHESHWDGMRWVVSGICPPGGRDQRDRATSAIPTPDRHGNPNLGGSFMEINAGKRGLSLSLKDPRGKELLTRLIETSDVIIEGFSNGTMERMGFGYQRLREINPRIIYVSQSGTGEFGDPRGTTRTGGPSAQGFSGLSEMSGLPEPHPPAGIGYSYLDWFGAYNMANAVLAALYRQRATGEGARIDASQVDVGIYLTGTAVLDYSVNGRHSQRYGNRSPHKPAAPHGAYRTAGDDRWIAIACFGDEHWRGFLSVLGDGPVQSDPRFATLEGRLKNQDALDAAVNEATQLWAPFELMEKLQAAGVPAGVCQTAQDRYDTDPQLAHLGWMVELPQTEIGTWPVKEVPVALSETPARIGGPLGRSGPNYGEDNRYVLGEILRLTTDEITDLEKQDVL